MNKFNILIGLILCDIVLTTLAVKYFGATELNPLCINFNFNLFMFIKIWMSGICLLIIYTHREDIYVKYAINISIVMYTIALINNLWHTVNYLYY